MLLKDTILGQIFAFFLHQSEITSSVGTPSQQELGDLKKTKSR